ncbi:MAG: acyl-CoA dehydrogenase family protein [Pseudomonadales bacterium]|nr:acyl-CoA dehydrogenase family protein [Pseudomonadales bacterium]
MDFNDTPKEAEFRIEVRTWLEANAPTESELRDMEPMASSKLWQKRKYDAGWACLRWPKEYGGRGASAIEQVIYSQEEAKIQTPDNVFMIGQGMCAPTMMAWATEEQKREYVPAIASGEKVWCQLFSEPAAGSDLAALTTKAERDGDDWIINGQKIWTSGAHYSDYGVIVLRTDPTVPKHKGLSYFFFDMKSEGVETRPIKQISGASNFNEVYFTNLRVPDTQRLGKVGQGWEVALTTLMNERASIGSGGGGGVNFNRLFKLAQDVNINDKPAIKNDVVREKLANWYVQESGLKFTGHRTLTALSRGELPGPENSIGKLVGAPKSQDMASFGLDLLEQSGAIWDDEYSDFRGLYQTSYMSSPAIRVAGGTDEIMANIIAERVLGLPQEVRVDKGIPFNEIPTSSSVK